MLVNGPRIPFGSWFLPRNNETWVRVLYNPKAKVQTFKDVASDVLFDLHEIKEYPKMGQLRLPGLSQDSPTLMDPPEDHRLHCFQWRFWAKTCMEDTPCRHGRRSQELQSPARRLVAELDKEASEAGCLTVLKDEWWNAGLPTRGTFWHWNSF